MGPRHPYSIHHWARLVLVPLLLMGACKPRKSTPTADPTTAQRAATGIPHQAPSVLLVTLDTTRPDHLEPYGSKLVKTPTLQRLAREGMLVENAYAVAPLTLPAHGSILTGLYPPQTGVHNNGTQFLPGEVYTLAERFSEQGYRTAAFVSAAVLAQRYGLDQGFDVYDDDLSKSRARHARMVPDRPAEHTVAAAKAWLDTVPADSPFFMWVHFYDPHATYAPPSPFREQYPHNPYAGEIAYMDAQLGALLRHGALGRRDELVVAVVADHGESLGEHGENTHGILAYRSTLHVPMIVWAPQAALPKHVTAPVSQIDIAPTLLDLARIPQGSQPLPGHSLAQPLTAQRDVYSESYLPYYTYGWSKLHVNRRGPWEHIDGPDPELFELDNDPHELNDLSHRHSDRLKTMQQSLTAFLKDRSATPTSNSLDIDQAALAQLRALGYVSMGSEPAHVRKGARPDPKTMVHLHTALEKARHFIDQRLYDEATAVLKKLLKKDPKNLAGLADLAQARALSGDTDGAFSVLNRALKLAPNHQQLRIMLAQVETQRGRLVQALDLTTSVIKDNPAHGGAYALQARIQARAGRTSDAQATLAEALSKDPKHPGLNALHAQLVDLPAGQVEHATARLRAAIKRDPFEPLAYRVLGQLLAKKGQKAEAVELYRSALEFLTDDADLQALLALGLTELGDADAEAHLRRALSLNSEFEADVRVALGVLLAGKGALTDAIAMYDRVLAHHPEHPASNNNKAIALARLGRAEQAVRLLKRLLRSHPGYADAHNNLAVLLFADGHAAGAERHARKALALDESLVESWDMLGAALHGQGKNEQALAAFTRCLALRPDYWSARLHRGKTQMALGHPHEALEDLQAALAENGQVAETYLALARLLEGPLGDTGKAQNYYRAFLARFESHQEAPKVRAHLVALATTQ